MSRDIQAGMPIFKQYATKTEQLGDRTVRFTITTSAPDRERDVIDASGIDVTAYERNPVVLWGHDYRALPIARTDRIERRGDGLVATATFASRELNPMSEQVLQLIRGGFLNAASIGFAPLEWRYNEARRGVDFLKSELLEWSCVVVPANSAALVSAKAAGIDLSVMREWARDLLARSEDGDVVLTLLDEAPSDCVTMSRNALTEAIRSAVAPLEAQLRRLAPPSRREPETVLVDTDALVEVTRDALRDLVRQQTRAAMNSLTGRLD